MTEKFTASNGWAVVEELRCLKIAHPNHYLRVIDLDVTAALREYFQHERDQELGRWRDPENPNMVVYQVLDNTNLARVTDEITGIADIWMREALTAPLSEKASRWQETARRYFEAHPEPKPWENAEPGEVWLLTINGRPEEPTLRVGGRDFDFATKYGGIHGGSESITAGRRIWPEQEDGE